MEKSRDLRDCLETTVPNHETSRDQARSCLETSRAQAYLINASNPVLISTYMIMPQPLIAVFTQEACHHFSSCGGSVAVGVGGVAAEVGVVGAGGVAVGVVVW